MLLGVVKAHHQVLIRSAAPVAIDGVNEVLPVSGRTVEVDHDDRISVSREQLRIPAIRPVISPGTLRPAVDEEFQRILFAGVEVWRSDESAFNPVSVRASKRKGVAI